MPAMRAGHVRKPVRKISHHRQMPEERHFHERYRVKKRTLPVRKLLDHADIIAADGDRDRDNALVELYRYLFLCGIDTLDNRLLALERAGDKFDNGALINACYDGLRDEEVADFGKAGLTLGNNAGMGDQLDQLLDTVPLLGRFDEHIALELVRNDDSRYLDVCCLGLYRLEDVIGYRPLLLRGGLDRKDAVLEDLGFSRNLWRCGRRWGLLCHNHRN